MKINVLVVVCLMVVMSAAMVAPVMAIDTGTSTITGNPGAVIDIVVTGSITGWALTAGTTNTKADTVTLGVSSNYIGWVVAVKDASDGSKPLSWAGRMVEWDGSAYVTPTPNVLGSNMTVMGADVTGAGKSTATLSKTDTTIETGTAADIFSSIPITIGQPVAYTDVHLTSPHVYRIIVTFTGTTP